MPTNIQIKNTNQRNQIKIRVDNSTVDPKSKIIIWNQGVTTYLKPGEGTDVWVAETRKVTIQEMPT
jgi:hypothetical protein